VALLLEARAYARELSADAWDFAVEIRCMRAAGASHSLLRWLVCRGYAEHAVERRPTVAQRRTFRKPTGLLFPEGTCFVLTGTGAEASRRWEINGGEYQQPGTEDPRGKESSEGGRGLPRWDVQLRELRVGGALVKQFAQPAPKQESILAAFEEEGWPPHIDDPLPPGRGRDPKQSLHTTIQNLNRHQRRRLIRFSGDGNGRGVRWKFCPARYSSATPELL
jgi:hypothetical protein